MSASVETAKFVVSKSVNHGFKVIETDPRRGAERDYGDRDMKVCNCGHPFTLHREDATTYRPNGPYSKKACAACDCWKPVPDKHHHNLDARGECSCGEYQIVSM